MIGRLAGKLLDCSPERVVLDVGGVGYEVQIPLSTFYALSSESGPTVSLHVHTHVREDALQLFGFWSPQERTSFELLIGISGVGPRLALAILSGIGVEDLDRAILQQDRARLQKIPGIGKKTAERLLLELRDKVVKRPDADSPAAGSAVAGAPADLHEDAASALVNLGYSRPVAERAVKAAAAVEGPGATIETVLRGALVQLAL